MKTLHIPQWLMQLDEALRPKTEQERRARATYSFIFIVLATVLLLYRLIQ